VIFFWAFLIFVGALIPAIVVQLLGIRWLTILAASLCPAAALIFAGVSYDKDAYGGDLQGAYTQLSLMFSPVALILGGFVGSRLTGKRVDKPT
jgi:hypothetical protein